MQQPMIQLVILAIVMGLAVGLVVLALIALTQGYQRVDSLIQLQELVGQVAIVEVPFHPGQVGKIRITWQGKTLQIGAKTDEPQYLRPGDAVIILAIEQAIAWVMPAPLILT
jgi:hypothetical protein